MLTDVVEEDNDSDYIDEEETDDVVLPEVCVAPSTNDFYEQHQPEVWLIPSCTWL